MSWWSAIDEVTLAALWTFVPGVLVATAIGLRGLWAVAVAPALSVATLGAWPVVAAWLGVPWNRLTALLAVALTAVVLGALLRPVRRRTAARAGSFRRDDLWALAGVVVAAAAIVVALRRGIGEPDIPPQTWDAVFHLNAVRHALETGDASTLHLGVVANTAAGKGFYPAAWHSLVALSTTDSVVVAANATTFVIAGVVWPLSVAALAKAVTPRWPWTMLAAPVAGAAYVAFPGMMVAFGTLWPNALSYALVPSLLALTAVALRPRGDTDAEHPSLLDRVPVVVAGVVGLAGVALAQPNGVVTYALLASPAVVAAWATAVPHAAARARLLLSAGAALWIVGTVAVVRFAGSAVGEYERARTASLAGGVLRALGDGDVGTSGITASWSWVVAGLTVLGALALLVSRQGRWLVASYVLSLVLYGLAADTDLGLRGLLRPWYADAVRLSGLVPLTGAVLMGAGVVGVATMLGLLARRVRPIPLPAVVGTATVVLVALVVVASGGLRLDGRAQTIASFQVAPVRAGSPGILTSDEELAMLERLDDELPDDAVILGNPFTGSALAYAVSGVEVVYTHVRGRWGTDATYVAQHFDDVATDPEVCAALSRLGVEYLYVDTDLYLAWHPAHELYPGLSTRAPDGDLSLVDEGGSAQVYRIDQCA